MAAFLKSQKLCIRGDLKYVTGSRYLHRHAATPDVHSRASINSPMFRLALPSHRVSCHNIRPSIYCNDMQVRYSQSTRDNEKHQEEEDPRKVAQKRRIIAYVGAFALLHLCVLYGRCYYKNQGKRTTNQDNSKINTTEYHDLDMGPNKLFYYKDYLFPHFALESMEKIHQFEIRPTDIFVASFPKSGTTWVQEIVYQVIHMDEQDAPKGNMEERFPYLEFLYPGVKEIAKRSGQRLIKTHLPHSLLPEQLKQHKGKANLACSTPLTGAWRSQNWALASDYKAWYEEYRKVIYIVRNPKDVSVSYYHYVRMLSEVAFQGSYESFFEKFMDDKVAYSPWSSHVLEYWQQRENNNLLFITYEELQQNLVKSVERIAKFLGCDLTQEQALHLASRCTFHSMKNNPNTNYSWWDQLGFRKAGESQFMRKGVTGDWENYMSKEMAERVDKMTKDRLSPYGLHLTDTIKRN